MFYGWYIVAASVAIITIVGGMSVYGFTAFVNPIADTFGWSYTQISLVMTLRGLETGFLAPLVGAAADRWPPKRLVFTGVTIAGLGLLLLSQVTNLAMFYLSFVIFSLGGSLGISVVPTTTIARWFKRNIGKANAVLAMGFSMGGLLVPVLVTMIDAYGWRTTLVILAVSVWVLAIPLSFVFRSRPEDYGLLPDGKSPDDLDVPGSSRTYDFGTGIKQALKMRAFWHMGITSMFQIAAAGAVVLHVMPYLTSLGIDRGTASMVAMFIPLASLAARLPYGWLADTFNVKYIITLSVILTSVGLFLFSRIDGSSFGTIVLFIIFFGFGSSGIMTLRAPILREYFGIKNFGTIFGLSGIFATLGMMVTPPVAGWIFDTRGVYDPIWLILSGACLIGVILMLTIPPPPETKATPVPPGID